MQSVSSRIWTRVVVSISYDDNHYTTGTSISILIAAEDNSVKINEIKEKIDNTPQNSKCRAMRRKVMGQVITE